MVSLWPWKAQDNSPASFEKTLASLATKISKSQAELDALRFNGRRYRVLWTIYTCFLYLIGLIILIRVKYWETWGIWECTASAASPVLIYLGNYVLNFYYTYRIETISQRLKKQQAEHFETIEKLKTATKYNTTHELLEKYSTVAPSQNTATPKDVKPTDNQQSRTFIEPPSTANIPRPEHISSRNLQSNFVKGSNFEQNLPAQMPLIKDPAKLSDTEPGPPEFAPNAFSVCSEYSPKNSNLRERWFDKVFELLLGEDETLPKNRVVLICQKCRLVNGQAPPGFKSLASLGRWRCLSCGCMNGEEEEAARTVRRIIDGIKSSDIDSDQKNKEEGIECVDRDNEPENAADKMVIKRNKNQAKT